MDFELTQEQELFRATTRRFLEADASLATLRATGAGDAPVHAPWHRAAELGWTGLLASEAAGGGSLSGRPVADAAIVAEEMGRQVSPGPFLPVSVVVAALQAEGSHAGVVAALVDGSAVATWALAETGRHWGPDEVTTTVDEDAGDVVVTGTKRFVEAAGVASHILVTGRTRAGLTQVLVPVTAAGVSVRPAQSLDLGRRFADVRLEQVRVPRADVVGGIGEAAAAVERQLRLALALQCAETVGALDRVFEITRQYLDDRFTFGRPLASYQALKHRVADLLLWLESSKAITEALVASIDAGDPEADRLASTAKIYLGDKSLAIIQDCVQLHGGIGVTWEHDLHLYLRRATVNRALYGSPEQHRSRLWHLLVGAAA